MRWFAALLLACFVPAVGSGADPKPKDLTCPEDMVFIPGGSFRLGATKKLVKVKPFCLDRTEVTAAEYEKCVQFDRCSSEGLTERSWATYQLYGDHPVNYVTWAQADRFCRVHYKRLPTEEEWEWAARGGPAGNVYPWGNDPPSNQLCWNGEGNDLGKGKRDKTCPATAYPRDATPHGVLGLGGNVAEWTSTSGGKGLRVVRGGTWAAKEPSHVAADVRQRSSVSERSFLVGIRCAADSESGTSRGP